MCDICHLSFKERNHVIAYEAYLREKQHNTILLKQSVERSEACEALERELAEAKAEIEKLIAVNRAGIAGWKADVAAREAKSAKLVEACKGLHSIEMAEEDSPLGRVRLALAAYSKGERE
jgi:hypothetical protein